MTIIAAENVYKVFKDKKVLNGISFSINKGEIVGLLGPNGVGKTTLIKILCDINKPTSGTIKVDDDDNIAVVFDFNGLYNSFNAIQNLSLYSDEKNSTYKIEQVLKTVDLWNDRFRRTDTYSKGMQRKLTMARALLKNPNILILDEPFDGLDIESRHYWIDFLTEWKKKGNSIVITSHIMSDIEELCDRLIIIKDGEKIVDRKTKELKRENSEFVSIKLYSNPDKTRLNDILKEYDYDLIYGNELRISHITIEKLQGILKGLLENDIYVEELSFDKDSLIKMYLKLMGGQA